MGAASTGGAPTGGAPTGGTAGATSTGGMPSGGTAGVMSTGGASGSGGSSGGTGGSAGGGGAGGRACPVVTPDACSAAEKTICTNEIAMHCGLTYEFWRDTGGGCMVAKADGFSIEWGADNNVLARKGVRPGTGDEVFTYEASYTADGTSFMGVYGWMQDPVAEYYIVDSWGGSRPPGARGEHLGSVEADDGVYDIYRTQQVDKPSIDPSVTTFYQYWSVRTSKRSCGTISVARHFYSWELAYLELGRFYEVSFAVEGYMSRGSGDVRLSVD
jgi:endo-1,4-beta-xylanase